MLQGIVDTCIGLTLIGDSILHSSRLVVIQLNAWFFTAYDVVFCVAVSILDLDIVLLTLSA